MVIGGLIAHPVDAAAGAAALLPRRVAGAPTSLTVFAGLVHAPDGSGHEARRARRLPRRRPDEAERELAPFLASGLAARRRGRPDALPGDEHAARRRVTPTGALNYWRSSFTEGLTDALIDTMVERFATVPSPMTAMLLEHFHGAVTRVRRHRHGRAAPPARLEPPASRRCGPTRPTRTRTSRWTRETHAALRPHLADRRWLNYLGDDQGDDAIRAAYGPNYDRLREVKRRYDPENVFHLNHNIAP